MGRLRRRLRPTFFCSRRFSAACESRFVRVPFRYSRSFARPLRALTERHSTLRLFCDPQKHRHSDEQKKKKKKQTQPIFQSGLQEMLWSEGNLRSIRFFFFFCLRRLGGNPLRPHKMTPVILYLRFALMHCVHYTKSRLRAKQPNRAKARKVRFWRPPKQVCTDLGGYPIFNFSLKRVIFRKKSQNRDFSFQETLKNRVRFWPKMLRIFTPFFDPKNAIFTQKNGHFGSKSANY